MVRRGESRAGGERTALQAGGGNDPGIELRSEERAYASRDRQTAEASLAEVAKTAARAGAKNPAGTTAPAKEEESSGQTLIGQNHLKMR